MLHLLDLPDSLDRARFQTTLERIASQARRQEIGRFVSIEISNTDTHELARLYDADYPHAAAVATFMRTPQRTTRDEEPWFENVTIDGVAHVHVVVPLRNSDGAVAAHAHGVFALAPEAFSQIYRRILKTVALTVGLVVATALMLYPIISRLLTRLARLSVRLLDANLDMIEVLGSAIAKRDSDTDVHNYRVSIYSVRLAEAVGADRHTIRSLIKGAFLHDVGKIGITDNILLKPGRLDEQEFEIMKQHVQHGLDIVQRSAWLADAATVVGYHHEKYDGSGYNEAKRADGIPLNARIFAIADVFDALTSERPYKKAFDFDRAMGILSEGSGSHFDPDLLTAFSGIARTLHEDYANRDDDKPRRDLAAIVDEYFRNETELIQESA